MAIKQMVLIPDELQSKPLGLWIDKMKHRWQIRGRLRAPNRDIQIMGCGLCILGALCEAFIENAPEAKEINAAWENTYYFGWDEAGEHKREGERLPPPVAAWWDRHHGHIVKAKELSEMAPILNDRCNWSFEQYSLLIAARFGLGADV